MLRLAAILTVLGFLPLHADDFSRNARPVLGKYCYECHGEKTQKGGIEVHQLDSTTSALQHHRFLKNIAHQIESGEMPPEDDVDELPTDAERAALVREIKAVLCYHASLAFRRPATDDNLEAMLALFDRRRRHLHGPDRRGKNRPRLQTSLPRTRHRTRRHRH